MFSSSDMINGALLRCFITRIELECMQFMLSSKGVNAFARHCKCNMNENVHNNTLRVCFTSTRVATKAYFSNRLFE